MRVTLSNRKGVLADVDYGIGHNSGQARSVYAITFAMDIDSPKELYHNESYNNAYNDIKKTLERYGFKRQQGSVYFGGVRVDAVKCVLAAQALAREHKWFSASVRDIRMLRIEDNNDLMPAVEEDSE